jgi:hypothetical protein
MGLYLKCRRMLCQNLADTSVKIIIQENVVIDTELFSNNPTLCSQVDASIEVLPVDVKEMLATEWTEPDLELEGSHLGRGDSYFDPEVGTSLILIGQSIIQDFITLFDWRHPCH